MRQGKVHIAAGLECHTSAELGTYEAAAAGHLSSATAASESRQHALQAKQRCHHRFWLTFKDRQLERNFASWLACKCRPMNVLLGSTLLAMAVLMQCKADGCQMSASLAAAGVLLVATSKFSQIRQAQSEVLFGLSLLLHTAAASSLYLPQWPAGANLLTWTSRALGCEALVIAPVSMMICFRRLVLWQSAAVTAAAIQAPLVRNKLVEVLPRTADQPMLPVILGLVILQGLLVPLMFCHTLERVARGLYLSRIVQRR